MTRLLRTIAIAIAAAAGVDPGVAVNKAVPLPVEIRSGTSHGSAAVRGRLLSALGSTITVAREGQGEAVVLIDGEIDPAAIRDGVTVSAVVPPAPNLAIVHAAAAARVLTGREGTLVVDVEADGVQGRRSVVTVVHRGIEVGRVERTWTDARRQRVHVPFVALSAGRQAMSAVVSPLDEETRADDNSAEVVVEAVEGPLRVVFVEPRPTWSAGFLRRMLEADNAWFEVASIVTASRGIDVRTGDVSAAVTAESLEAFHVAVAGAPEELKAEQLRALRTFVSDRGGTLVLVPDRRPSGEYTSLVPSTGFDEVLLEAPVALGARGGAAALKAGELALLRDARRFVRPLASLPDGRAAVAAWPMGAGTIIFSGALDSWRFRGDEGNRFEAFWKSAITAAAMSAPPPLSIETGSRPLRRNSRARAIARLRATELTREADGSIALPEIAAVVSDGSGRRDPVRWWPTPEPGVFHGDIVADGQPPLMIQASAGRARASAPMIVAANATAPRIAADEAALLATATGGVLAAPDDLTAVTTHLRSLERGRVETTVHPMRSEWWILPFAIALSGEWALRRRRGER